MIIRNISGGSRFLGWYNYGVEVANGATLTLSENYVNNTSLQYLLDNHEFEVVSYSTDPDQRYLVQSELEVIPYDNTTSGLTATTIPAAIDEIIASGGGIAADGISFDPGTGPYTTHDVQAALDEIAATATGSSIVGFNNTTCGLTGDSAQEVIVEVANTKKYYNNHLSVTDAAVTPVVTIPVTAGNYVGIEVHAIAHNAGGESAYYTGHVLATDAAIVTSNLTSLESAGAIGWDMTFTFGAGNVYLNASNGAVVTVDWTVTANVVTSVHS